MAATVGSAAVVLRRVFELNTLTYRWPTLSDAVTEDFVHFYRGLCIVKITLTSIIPIDYDLYTAFR